MKVFNFVCILRLIYDFCQSLILQTLKSTCIVISPYSQKSAHLLLLHWEGPLLSDLCPLSSKAWKTSSLQAKRFLLEPCAPGPEISGSLFFKKKYIYAAIKPLLQVFSNWETVLLNSKYPKFPVSHGSEETKFRAGVEMKDTVMNAAFIIIRVLRFQIIEKTLSILYPFSLSLLFF